MAETTNLEHHIGTDHAFEHSVLNAAKTAAINIAGWALSYMIKRSRNQPDADAILTKTTLDGVTISGAFDADPEANTQLAIAAIADTDLPDVAAGTYVWELKRTDPGFETVLGDGDMRLIRSVHRT